MPQGPHGHELAPAQAGDARVASHTRSKRFPVGDSDERKASACTVEMALYVSFPQVSKRPEMPFFYAENAVARGRFDFCRFRPLY